ncbi:hypothetical protein D3875_20800 [Deinococcus cavernae]|uniref:Uncharacterized protein n=1 Tax=Deinococcus cavernae TaxID=2320857 RepID=A0A418V146_9DEIO|nr:hypothetical protein [Deinococcus cavernae]RJF69555.1 hypothetical protein D3875_20800 [Deinococcus cavernae]
MARGRHGGAQGLLYLHDSVVAMTEACGHSGRITPRVIGIPRKEIVRTSLLPAALRAAVPALAMGVARCS